MNKRITAKSIVSVIDTVVTLFLVITLSLICINNIFGDMGVYVFAYVCYLTTHCFSFNSFNSNSVSMEWIESAWTLIHFLNFFAGAFILWLSLFQVNVFTFISVIYTLMVVIYSKSSLSNKSKFCPSSNTDIYVKEYDGNRVIMLFLMIFAVAASIPFGGYMESQNVLALMIVPVMLIFQKIKVNQVNNNSDIKKYETQISYGFTIITLLAILVHLVTGTKDFQEAYKDFQEVSAAMISFIEGVVSYLDASTGGFICAESILGVSLVVILFIVLIGCYINDSNKGKRDEE